MLDVSLRELEYVVALDAERSYTRAARRLHMAQPALSKAIIRLERRLGVPLFDRTSRRVELTPAGQTLATEAADIIGRVQVAMARTRDAPGHTLRVHVSEPALQTPRRVIFAIRSDYPELSVHQTTLPAAMVVDELRSARLSLTIGEPIPLPWVHCESIRTEPVGALVGAQHPLAGSPHITLEEVTRFPLVSIDERLSRWNTWVTRMLTEHGYRPRWTSATVFGIAAGSDLVSEGNAVLVTLRSVGDEATDALRWIPFEPSLDTTWYLNWSKDRSKTPALSAAITAARRFARSTEWCRPGESGPLASEHPNDPDSFGARDR